MRTWRLPFSLPLLPLLLLSLAVVVVAVVVVVAASSFSADDDNEEDVSGPGTGMETARKWFSQ